MKKTAFLTTALLALTMALAVIPASAAEEKVTINVYNWGQYMALGEEDAIHVNQEFEKKTGIHVNYLTYDSNETMYSTLKIGGSNYDIVIPSDYMVERMIAEDMLEKLDFTRIPNFQNIDASFRNPSYDPDNAYSVPYTYGTVGLIYNKKYITDPVDSWSALWNKAYKGKILMFDNPRDAFGIAELVLGYSQNTTDETELRACQQKLREQNPLVQSYVMDQIFEQMENEEAWIAPYYAGDYLTMAEENENLAFVHPKEGFNKFVDAICIPKGAAHKKEAEMYINFLCTPEISGKNCDYLGYSTPISVAKEYLSDEYANSTIAYPSAETLARGEIFNNLPADTNQLMDSLWSQVKIRSNTWILYVAASVVAAGLAALVVIFGIRKKRRAAQYDD